MNCRALLETILLSRINTPRDNLFFRLDAVQKTMKTEKNVNELSDLPEKRSFLALSILLETIHMFRLDAFQKTMKIEKYVNELSGLLEK